MKSRNRKAWFSAKRQPCSWQGWMVFIAYLVSLFAGIFIERKTHSLLLGLGIIVGLMVLLEIIRRTKSEQPPAGETRE